MTSRKTLCMFMILLRSGGVVSRQAVLKFPTQDYLPGSSIPENPHVRDLTPVS